MQRERQNNIELCRVCVMLFIVIHHCIVSGLGLNETLNDGGENFSSATICLIIMKAFVIVSVNVFFLISGYFGIKLRTQKIKKLLEEVLFYSVAIYAVCVLLGAEKLTLKNILKYTILSINNYWFVIVYLALMFISPALNYAVDYLKENNYLAPEVECLKNDDGTTTLHLYEIVKDDDESSHTVTSAWYTVDEYGKGEDDILGNTVEFPNMSLGKIAEYVKTPIALTYNEEGETHNEWKITDAATINACIQAISQINVEEETELRTMDAGETLVFQMADGNTWTLDFEAGNLLRNNTCYETDGWKKVQNIIRDYLTEEELQ